MWLFSGNAVRTAVASWYCGLLECASIECDSIPPTSALNVYVWVTSPVVHISLISRPLPIDQSVFWCPLHRGRSCCSHSSLDHWDVQASLTTSRNGLGRGGTLTVFALFSGLRGLDMSFPDVNKHRRNCNPQYINIPTIFSFLKETSFLLLWHYAIYFIAYVLAFL